MFYKKLIERIDDLTKTIDDSTGKIIEMTRILEGQIVAARDTVITALNNQGNVNVNKIINSNNDVKSCVNKNVNQRIADVQTAINKDMANDIIQPLTTAIGKQLDGFSQILGNLANVMIAAKLKVTDLGDGRKIVEPDVEAKKEENIPVEKELSPERPIDEKPANNKSKKHKK